MPYGVQCVDVIVVTLTQAYKEQRRNSLVCHGL